MLLHHTSLILRTLTFALITLGAAAAVLAVDEVHAIVLVSDLRANNGIYLITKGRGLVFSPVVNGALRDDSIPFSTFKDLHTSPAVPRNLLSMAYSKGALYACDQSVVFKIDLAENYRVQQLFRSATPLTSIAVTGTGQIAVTDTSQRRITLYSLQGDTRGKASEFAGYRPIEVVSSETKVFFVDVDRTIQAMEPSSTGLARTERLFDQDMNETMGAVYSVASIHDVVYISAENGLFVLPLNPTSPTMLPARYLQLPPARISVTDANLIAALPNETIIVRSRPVPVTVTLRGGLQENGKALADTYIYLSQHKPPLLPSVPRSFLESQSLDQLLTQTNLIVPQNIAKLWTPNRLATLKSVLCILNGVDPRDDAQVERTLEANHALVMPDIQVSLRLEWKDLNLGSTTLRQQLQQDGIDPEDIAALLLDYNKPNPGTFEDLLVSYELSPTPTNLARVQPGMLLKVHGDQLEPAGDAKQPSLPSGLGTVESATPVRTDEMLASSDGKHFLSLISGRFATLPGLPAIKEVLIQLGPTTVRTFEFSTDAGMIATRGLKSLDAAAKKGLYLVTRTLTSANTTLTFVGSDGGIPNLLNTTGSSSHVAVKQDPRSGTGIIINDEIALGYEAVPVSTLLSNQPFTATHSEGNPLDRLLNLREGTVKRPVFAWRFNLVLPATELSDESGLAKVQQANPQMDLFTSERLSTVPSSFPLYDKDSKAPANPVAKAISENRTQLLNWIHYPDISNSIQPLPSLERFVVAVAEHPNSIITSHPSLRNIPWDPAPSWVFQKGCPQRNKDKLVESDSIMPECDHGTLIVGLLEDGADDLHLPGLAPGVKVDVVDPLYVKNVFDQIDSLIPTDSLVIVNFSQLYKNPAEWNTKQALMRMDSDDWKKHVLLIVASGEQQPLLAYNSVHPPLNYLDTTDHHAHIIGVGAASSDGKAAFATAAGSSDPLFGYGKKFVQIIAPGIDVVSTVYDSWYGKASGSSFAAPQVTSAALLLRAAGLRTPSKIKARLIYTSDWLTSDASPTNQPIWGGYLNVTRAALMPWKDIIVFQGDSTSLHVGSVSGPDSRIELIDAKAESYETSPPDPPTFLRFSQILRLSRCTRSDKFRVVYRSLSGKVAIAIAKLDGEINYNDEKVMDPWGRPRKTIDPSGQLRDVPLYNSSSPLRINDIYDFTASSFQLGDDLDF